MRRVIRDRAVLVLALASVLEEGAKLVARRIAAARKPPRNRAFNRTLRPGTDTPLWNEVLKLLRPELTRYGAQAQLGRILGLPRQRVNAFVTGGTEMPDAERTLELLAWLSMLQRSRTPRRNPKRIQARSVPSGAEKVSRNT